MPTLKTCTKCKQIKPATLKFFPPRKDKQDGLNFWCRGCHNKDCRERHQQVRLEVLSHYGNQCACCHITNIEFLGIDHVEGGGVAHRKTLNRSNIYYWLRTNNYPEGFQILCHNCNLAKGF